MRNIKLKIEYDGTDFCGWQIQVDDRTVQAEIDRSLTTLTGSPVRVAGAGRTDSGVHAFAQVASFKTESKLPVDVFVRGGNSRLPLDVRIVSAEEVAEDFNARYSATSRRYRYFIAKRQKTVGRRFSWYYSNPLNLEAMNASCADFLGTRDFQSFCQAKAAVEHYLCHVKYAFWRDTKDELIFEICANRFLHNMVRILVGTMVEIGDNRLASTSIAEMLAAKDRAAAGATAPAHGLFLVAIDY